MPDDPAATATPEPAKPQEPQIPEEPAKQEPKDVPLGEAGEKALEAWKQRAKVAETEAAKAKAKAQEYEDAQKSELEKAQGKLSRVEQAKAEAEAKLLRYEVAQEKEVPAKLVPLLTGSTKEELEAQASLILENVKAGEPKPDFDGGARQPAPEPKSPEQEHNEAMLGLLGLKPNT